MLNNPEKLNSMKKLTLFLGALMIAGASFAHEGGKGCCKDKKESCSKKESKACCKKGHDEKAKAEAEKTEKADDKEKKAESKM